MKHVPFESIYRTDFEVVEEREGKFTRYPHNSQLPMLLRALNLEFYGALPGRLARADGRADGFHKIALKTAAMLFCNALNGARKDALRLHSLPNMDLVSKVAIVQQITEHTRRGPLHRFRFYAGEDFSPEIRLNGRSLVFTDHVLQRFSSRVPNKLGEDLSNFLLVFYGSQCVLMSVGPGPAFIYPYLGSTIAFTYEQTASEFIITTCLTVDEINTLTPGIPPRAFNLHYGANFTRPRVRHWLPTDWAIQLYQHWERKVPLPPAKDKSSHLTWHRVANWVRDRVHDLGHNHESRFLFLDNLPGPCYKELLPGQPEPQVEELKIYKATHPEYDWDAAFAKVEAEDRAEQTGGEPLKTA